MTKLVSTAALLALLGVSGGTAWAEKAACTASIEDGKKYHWVTYQGGAPHRSGYIKFTTKRYGKWIKVEHFTDRPKSKQTFWGYHDDQRVNFKNKATGERWTAWMKVCEGPLLPGNVYVNDKAVRTFHIDTSKVRD